MLPAIRARELRRVVSAEKTDKYTKIQVNISYFNQDTKQNSATSQNAEIPQSKVKVKTINVDFCVLKIFKYLV